MVGSMSANFYGSDAAAVQNYLLSIIQTKMNQDLVLSGAVESTLFLGNRTTYAAAGHPSPTGVSGTTEGSQASRMSSSAVILTSSVAAAAALLILLGALLLASRKSRRSRSPEGKVNIISEVEDLELVETKSSIHSSDFVDEESQLPVQADQPQSVPFVLSEEAIKPATSQDQLAADGTVASNGDSAATVVSDDSNSGESDVCIGENMDASSNLEDKTLLPPKPPQGPSKQPPPVQQTLAKPRRRKRKKKKKLGNPAILPRTNSRENMNTMETITEVSGDCEVSREDEDSDSEYSYGSYETDESVSRSRDPSPARSDGCGVASRDASPVRSERGGAGAEIVEGLPQAFL
jgi:hypothetical protein